jgi:hypothetical protein
MAICHVRTSFGSAAHGQSAVAKHDYIQREGKYSRDAGELEHAASRNMPEWAEGEPRQYWRAADAHERANGRLYVEVQVALPNELDGQQRRELAAAYAERLCGGERLPHTIAIHRGLSKDPGKPDNPHAHILISERRNDGIERDPERWFKRANRKTPERGGALKWEQAKRLGWAAHVRQTWAEECNRALAAAGRPERIDPRTLAEQAREALERGDLERAAELSRDPEPKRGAGEGIEQRRKELRERGVPEEELPQASYAVQRCQDVQRGNAAWLAECRQRAAETLRARNPVEALWERYQRRWPEHAAADKAILDEIARRSEGWRRELRERFQRLLHGRYWETARPKALPRELAEGGRCGPEAAAHPQHYAEQLPARYRRRWDEAQIVRRALAVAEQARGTLRARLSRDPQKHAEGQVRRALGAQAQRLDREMREDMQRHQPRWEVLQRHDTMRGEEIAREHERRERREREERARQVRVAGRAREVQQRGREPDLGPSR